ncbi:hypothetical protein [Cohnella sp. WQ 127256]|uniref:hypothetical protein n=1 Tax=Cohnella sp. WQ 127256 TaxID=2938790 RepID=UPI0021198FF3|nr:hypothetical protein [Cohnella sp. WQ 127256]
MSDSIVKKRSYTIPVLFIIMVIMTTLIIIYCSKYLLSQQEHTTDQGQRLAEQYNYALVFAGKLHDGADLLLTSKSQAETIRAAKMLGEANLASSETTSLFIEATQLKSGQTKEDASARLRIAMSAIVGPDNQMSTIGEHEGSLTQEEIAQLTLVRDGAAQMQQALNGFRPPSSEDGFRQMVRLGNWVEFAKGASLSLEQLAAKL